MLKPLKNDVLAQAAALVESRYPIVDVIMNFEDKRTVFKTHKTIVIHKASSDREHRRRAWRARDHGGAGNGLFAFNSSQQASGGP